MSREPGHAGSREFVPWLTLQMTNRQPSAATVARSTSDCQWERSGPNMIIAFFRVASSIAFPRRGRRDMATITNVTLVDDIDGAPAAETVRFALDGKPYEIDLSETNAKELREAFAGYIESARRDRDARTVVKAAPRAARELTQAIRVWARSQGLTLAERG